jgi:hypothetical protein
MSSGFALALVAALILVPTAATSPAAAPDGVLAVSTFDFPGGGSSTALSIASADAVARVSVTAPPGYSAAFEARPGGLLGFASVGLSDVPGTTSTSVFADLVAEDPGAHVGTSGSEACAPGRHAAVWKAALSVLGQSFDLVFYVDPVAGGGVLLRYCPIWPSPTVAAGVTASRITLLVDNVFKAPATTGRYTWSALVTPPGAGLAADGSRTFEVRAVEPRPHRLTLRARYDAKRKNVVLSGKLTAVGEPEAGAEVDLTSQTSSFGEFTFLEPVQTNASGEFSVTRRVEVTTQFSADAELPDRACTPPTSAPAGCARETVTPPSGASTIVRVRTAADPKLALKRKDQALARRANIALTDLPAGWQEFESFPFFDCKTFSPRLADLTATGDVESRIFYSEQAEAASRGTVYGTEADARKAFTRTARLGWSRCVASELTAAGAKVLQLGTTPFPRLGAETRAFRLVYQVDQFVVTIDRVSFRQGRTVVHLGLLSETVPFAGAEELARKVAARVRRG